MARRVSMPAADDLFRKTGEAAVRAVPDAPATPDEAPAKGASGRIRHDEKMTVYVTSDELLAIEQARLSLRGTHKLAVDRGRLVREALHLILEDLDERGDESLLVQRLREA